MQVIDRLAAPAPDVRDEPIAVIGDPFRRASSAATAKSRPSSGPSASVSSAAEPDVPAGHEQDVGRGARSDVPDRDDQLVVVDSGGGNLARHDPAEEAVGGAHQSTGFELMRNPIVPTRPAIRYDT